MTHLTKAILFAAAAFVSQPCVAASQARPFNVPEQNARTGLVVLAQQAGVQILFPFEAGDARIRAVQGDHSVSDALTIALAGSGLEIVSNNGRTIVLRRAAVRAAVRKVAYADSPARVMAAAAAPAVPGEVVTTDAGDIVVTARRREERLQDVPASIVAFDQKMLSARAVATPYDLAKFVPGLTTDTGAMGPGQGNFSVRGRGTNFGAAAGSVETYFADVPLSSPFNAPRLPAQFFDISSFNVQKGPQGTLFGRSTTGGAVVIVPQAPTETFGGYARVQGGNYGNFQAEGAVNIPLGGDKAALRIAGFDWQRKGYMHSLPGVDAVTGAPLPATDYNNQDVTEVRATLLLKPTDALQNSTIVTYHRDKNRYATSAGLNRLGFGTPKAPGVFYSPNYGTRTSVADTNLTIPETRAWAIINTTTFQITDDITFKNIFGYIHVSGYLNDANDADNTTLTAVAINLKTPPRPRRNTQITDEVQLQGRSFGGNLSWTLGALVDKTRQPTPIDKMNYSTVILNFGSLFSRFEKTTIDSYGIYAAGTYAISDGLHVSAGYRHSGDRVKTILDTEPGVPLVAVPANFLHLQQNSNGNTWNLGLDWKPSSKTMLYGGYRRGYKRGGFNVTTGDPNTASFKPESVDDFNIGVKTEFDLAGIGVRLNVEGFYDLYRNMQVSYFGFVPSVGVTAVTTNAPRSTFRGFDADLSATLTPWLTVTANYELLDAYHTSWPDNTVPGQTGDLSVNPVPFAPKTKVSSTFRFHGELPGNAGELAIAPSVSYTSKSYTTAVPVRLTNATAALGIGQLNQSALGGDVVPAYTVIDLRAEWNRIFGSNINAALNVTNLTNKFYILGTNSTFPFGVETFAYAPPRMVSFELSTHF